MTQELHDRVARGLSPKLIVIDESVDDQLVPMNQADGMEAKLSKVSGLKVVRGKRCVGVHAAPWEQGNIIWEEIKDILDLLSETS